MTCIIATQSLSTPFGVEGGNGVVNAAAILDEVNKQGLPDLEVFLSYAMFTERIGSIEDINPFGHIAIAVATPQGYRVITVNQKAVSGKEKLFFRIPLHEYFYGVTRRPGAIHGSHYGLAYARSSVSLQIRGLTEETKAGILAKIETLDQDHLAGRTSFDISKRNCAHLTSEILQAAGMVTARVPHKFPVALFNDILSFAKKNAANNLQNTYVFYQRVPSDHRYVSENIPIPAPNLIATIFNIFGLDNLRQISGPGTVVAATSNQGYLASEAVARLVPISNSCHRLWIVPFVRAILRRW